MSEENGPRPGSETATLEEANALAANSGTDWLAEIKSIALLILAVLAFHSFIAKPFYIPSESMMPVLLKGDRLVVSKFAYGWSYVSPSFHILPEMPGRVLGKLPERGDIVIAQPRGRSEDYIKRVIGLPGDTLEVRGGQLILNGQSVPQTDLPPLAIPIDADAPCDPIQFPGAISFAPDGERVCLLPARKETLPNGRSYTVIDMGMRPTDWYGPVRIPPGHVFLMGDNRDNSADSRVLLEESGLGGPVPVESIGGRAEFITFSLNGTATLNPLSWPGAFRQGRAFSSLHPVRDGKAGK
jgi:signal peptidase I